MADPANYVFLPWVRQGAAAGIQTPETTATGVVSVTVNLRINEVPEVQQSVRLYGPGDVTGIDQQQIIRTEPRPQSTDFEPNYFPAIEFDRPDFPWLFTPAKADPSGKLRPWLCLVVVKKQPGVTIQTDANLPLPVLEIRSPAEPDVELPDLKESWAWAHVQIARAERNKPSLTRALAGDPALTVSRLLCPRRLDSLTDYVACVVPTFELGRKAGLGEPITADDEKQSLALAWTKGVPPLKPLRLPIYFHWDFRTGTRGDFESLVGLLQARKLPIDAGKRPMDISKPGFQMPDAGKTVLGLESALRAVDSKPDEWSNKAPFQTALQKILNTPAEILGKETNEDPIVAPPIYGRWQAARHRVEITPLNWLDELNLDPRHRAVAALGTQVVQMQQEQLMASAWEQLGEAPRMNQIRRQAQLGRAVNRAYHSRHFANFSEETLLKVLAPAQSRLVIEPTKQGEQRGLLSQRISAAVPANVVSVPMRRLASPRNVISARFAKVGAPPMGVIAKLNTVATFVVAFVIQPERVVTLDRVTQNQTGQFGTPLKQTVLFSRVAQATATAPPLRDFTIVGENSVPQRSLLNFSEGPPDSRDADMFRKVVKLHQDYVVQALTPVETGSQARTDLLDTKVKDNLLKSINPENTIYARVRASESLDEGAEQSGDRLAPIFDAPSFPQPMYEALRDLSQDYLFAGLEQVPPNTVAVLEPNPEFVEAFLIGLNSEMSSELLWRNYPTDQRGTFFQQFWDTDSSVANVLPGSISTWNGNLGKNTPGTSDKLVLLIRGELLRRYPNSVIYAARAIRPSPGAPLDVSKDERHPLFRGTLKPDVTFLGFDLTDLQALGKTPDAPEGWFFVIQQQPTEPRFGLDVADFEEPTPPPLNTWSDLSWRHIAKTAEELNAVAHVSAGAVLPKSTIQDVTWGKNSAHQAFITLQRPVRIAIHARQMIRSV